MRYAILFFTAVFAANAQITSFGVKAGVPVTSPASYASLDEDTGRWTAGLTGELRLNARFSVEIDALIRAYSFASLPSSSSNSAYRLDAKAWDFPFLLKYRASEGRIRPFVDAGYAITHESFDASTLTGSFLDPGYSIIHAPFGASTVTGLGKSSDTATGPAGGVGVEFQYRRVKIAPEARYIHLFHSGLSHSNDNLVTLLVGFTF